MREKMNKIWISLGLLFFVIAYFMWHITYRSVEQNLDESHKMAPFSWQRISYIQKGNETETQIEQKEECFSINELTSLFSLEKDTMALQELCESEAQEKNNGYQISANCRNASARFVVKVDFSMINDKLYEWQQTIYDVNHIVIQKERITFKQLGACRVSH